ncbi:MAG: S-layer homology domain-containing protein [Oscillospiraceae bacterium]|nr:S-layer homology domain-containing protein [Oscillospiraceae bacterium]
MNTKRFLSLALTLALVFGLLVAMPLTVNSDWAGAYSSQIDSFNVFQKVNTYIPGQFTDVDEDMWYDEAVATVYEYGLMAGKGGDEFDPAGNITVAEAITIAARVHNIYNGGSGEFEQSEPWHQAYVDYAVANGTISVNDFTNYNRAATRAEMAYIFARTSVPILLMYVDAGNPPPNTVNSLPDVDSNTLHYGYIRMLYEAGILTGSDEYGTFYPDSNIIRAETAAIISRVILLSARLSGKTFGD